MEFMIRLVEDLPAIQLMITGMFHILRRCYMIMHSLVSLYAEAYQLTKNENYKRVVEETLEFIDRELTNPEGGFYSALGCG